MKKLNNAIEIKIVNIYYLHKGDNIPFYIGKTKDSLNKRIYRHRVLFGSDTLIENIDKVSISDWKFWESHYINLFKSWGFSLKNQNKGGGGLPYHSQKTKTKMSKTWKNKSKKELNIINKKRRHSQKGIPKPGGGRKPYTLKQKIALGNREYYKSKEFLDKCKKSVIMLDKHTLAPIKEFSSVTEAAYFVNRSQASMSICLSKKTSTCGGYKWKFKN
jgi:hypothetical protein